MVKDNQLVQSFVGNTQHFYVLRNEGLTNPEIPPKYAVYPSVDTYNTRSETPTYIEADRALVDFKHELAICPQTLTTNWPSDRDETDLGLSNPINIWHNQFDRQREGRSHAA